MAKIHSGGESGLILGKFLPPHRGHQFLVDFARHYVDDVTVLVCSLASEPIPGAKRADWMRELFPDCRIVHVTDENPSWPHEHPDFWDIWCGTIRRACPRLPDLLFTSETYGEELAHRLGIRHVSVDPARELVPVSGTVIREKPLTHWRFLPEVVRAHYVKRVAILGPESTGKTTLARDLARHFDTVWSSEYARSYLDYKAATQDRRDPATLHDLLSVDDVLPIARGQHAAIEALARHANRVLFLDTDLVMTRVYGEMYYEHCPDWLNDRLADFRPDLTLLLEPDVPWIADPQRDLSDRREEVAGRCRAVLEELGRPHVTISGGWGERLQAASAAVEEMLRE